MQRHDSDYHNNNDNDDDNDEEDNDDDNNCSMKQIHGDKQINTAIKHNVHIPIMRIPDNDHAVWSNISCDNPAPIIAAACASDCIRLTQKNEQ